MRVAHDMGMRRPPRDERAADQANESDEVSIEEADGSESELLTWISDPSPNRRPR